MAEVIDLIDPQGYQDIADAYALAMRQIQVVASYYYDAAVVIKDSAEFGVELDLIKPMWQAYQAAVQAYAEAPSSLSSAVESLQRHVISRARKLDGTAYTSMDDWLSDNGITVEQEFATISTRVGFPIETEIG